MLNIAVIMGRLTAEPELRTTSTGVSLCRFSVAVDRRFSSGGERQTDFIRCIAWRQTAEFISRYFHKGSMIAINGSIQQNQYTDKDGNKRESFEIVVDNANFCGSKAESGTSGGYNSEQQSPASFSNADTGDFQEISMSDDDLPF